jgi:hypothetical protein
MAADPTIVAAICAIPRDFRGGDKSPVALVAASGFRSVQDSLTIADIRAHLASEPNLIDDWALWSADKRTSEGWYFVPVGDGGHVGYLGRRGSESFFTPRGEACAQFILHEIRSIDSYDQRRRPST